MTEVTFGALQAAWGNELPIRLTLKIDVEPEHQSYWDKNPTAFVVLFSDDAWFRPWPLRDGAYDGGCPAPLPP